MKYAFSFVLIILSILLVCCSNNEDNGAPTKNYSLAFISDTCVYSNYNHTAFTSLIEYKNDIYLAFREGPNHVPTNISEYGIIKVLKKEGEKWNELSILENPDMDLRDPFFIVMEGKLRMYCGYNQFVGESNTYQHSGTAYADFDGNEWSDFKIVKHDAPHIVWIWKIRKYKDCYYGVGYLEGEKPILFSSEDGDDWKTVSILDVEGIVSEADLNFIGDSLSIWLRKDTPSGSPSYLGNSNYPFTEFEWREMNNSLACPEFFCHPESKQTWICGREYLTDNDGKVSKVIVSCYELVKRQDLRKFILVNESQGWDKGYPSFLMLNEELLLSYYCYDNTGRTQIRLLTMYFY